MISRLHYEMHYLHFEIKIKRILFIQNHANISNTLLAALKCKIQFVYKNFFLVLVYISECTHQKVYLSDLSAIIRHLFAAPISKQLGQAPT